MITKTAHDIFSKAAGVFNPYNLNVRNADYLDPGEVGGILRQRMVEKANDTETPWTHSLLGGTVPGALLGGLATRKFKGALTGAGIGLLTGGAVKLNDDFSKKRAISDLDRFDANLGNQKAYVAQAMANARLERDVEAQRRAMARNDADRELHQNAFGNQQLRRVMN